MFKEFYQLSADPFRLTPDHRFVFPHQSYSNAHANMRYALDQGDGVLVVSGRSGTGKTTLVQDFLAELSSEKVVAATIVSTHLQEDDVLRMVAYAFDLEAKDVDKATLLRELESFLQDQSRALLIIDEAQNLTEAALEEVRMLTNMHIGSRQLLQVFLVGQEKLHERLHTQSMEQLHQRLMAVCDLRQLTLQETCDFILHRLRCAGWQGNPEITAEAFILIHRCSQGLPRYICKLCSRLFLQGAIDGRSQLTADAVAEEVRSLQSEQLLPLSPAQGTGGRAAVFQPQAFLESTPGPIEQRLSLTADESDFLGANPAVFTASPEPPAAESAALGASLYEAVKPWVTSLSGLDWQQGVRLASRNVKVRAGAALALLVLFGSYQWGAFNSGSDNAATEDDTSSRKLQQLAVEIPHKANIFWSAADPRLPYERLRYSSLTDLLGMIADNQGYQLSQDRVLPGPFALPGTFFGEPPRERAAVMPPAGAGAGADSPIESTVAMATEPQPALASAPPLEPAPQAVRSTEEEIYDLLQQGDNAIAKDLLTTPKNESAWHYYQQVFMLDPGNSFAARGLQRIAARYGELATLVMGREQFDRAEVYIGRGLSVASRNSDLLALQTELQARREAQQAAINAQASEPEPEPEPESRGFFGAIQRFFSGE